MWKTLREDLFVRLAAAAFLAFLLPYLLPLLNAEQMVIYGERFPTAAFILIAIAAFRFRLQRLEESSERLFWNLWTAAFLVWLVQDQWTHTLSSESYSSVGVGTTQELLYFAYYALIAWSLESRPHLSRNVEAREPLGPLEPVGGIVFVLGLVLYLVAIPAAFDTDSYLSWVPSTLVYTLLDGYLVLRLTALRRSCTTPRWRRVYSWLLVVAALFMLTDFVSLLMSAEIILWVQYGTLLDVVWLVPIAVAVLAARVREHGVDAPEEGPQGESRPERASSPEIVWLDPFLVFAICFLFLHFSLSILGVGVPIVRQARDICALGVFSILATMALVRVKVLRTRRQQAEEALTVSAASYRDLFEETKDVVYKVNDEGRITDINTAGLELFGYSSKEEFLGMELADYFQEPADYVDYLEALRKQGFVKDYEVALKDRQGKRLVALTSTTIVGRHEERAFGTQGILRDVTEERRLEQQLRQARKMEAVGQLAGGVAHDFNNQLTAIAGFTNLALEDLPKDSRVAKDLRSVLDASSHAADLVGQLLAFSRQQPLNSRVVNLNSLIKDTAAMLERLVNGDIAVEFVFGEELENVKVDVTQIQQVMINLAINARDAMAGGGELRIETTNTRLNEDFCNTHAGAVPGRYVMMAMTDSGCGMSEEVQGQIFDPFFTTKEIGQGTGLGLATTYGIVKQHGGYIGVQSEEGTGTTFRVYLPRVDDTVEDVRAVDLPLVVERGTETIAVVEDEAAVREVTRRYLESQGYRVLVASGPREAEELFAARGGEIDLLLTDVVMPEMDGPSLYLKLFALEPTLTVLYMSGHPQKSASGGGFLDLVPFIQKPFTRDQLAEKVREVLVV